ncbi:MAG: MFS transporter [Desulfobacterales bacterium]|nr:MFS transporter [Desulfobacterales bacterium]
MGISGAEFFWGLGLPLIMESTFLQLFLKSLGASSFTIGLIPFFLFFGTSVFPLVSSFFTSNTAYQRRAVITLHFVSGFSLLLFGGFVLIFGNVSYILVVFIICYAVFSICIGLTVPVWLNYIVKIFSEEKSVSALALMLIAQNVAKFISSLLIVRFVDKFAFSIGSSALAFTIVGLLFAMGAAAFFLTKELPLEEKAKRPGKRSFLKYVIESIRQILRNRNYIYFLVSDFDFFIIITIISFYAAYATTYCGIDPAIASGAFVAFIYGGAICTNIFLGWLGFLSMKNKYILSKISSIAAMIILILFHHTPGFLTASFLLGVARGTRMVLIAPAVKKLSGQPDATSYFAVGPILVLPFASGLPLVYGHFLDHFSWLGGDSYRIVFLASMILLLGTLLGLLKTDLSGKSETRGK